MIVSGASAQAPDRENPALVAKIVSFFKKRKKDTIFLGRSVRCGRESKEKIVSKLKKQKNDTTFFVRSARGERKTEKKIVSKFKKSEKDTILKEKRAFRPESLEENIVFFFKFLNFDTIFPVGTLPPLEIPCHIFDLVVSFQSFQSSYNKEKVL